MTFLFSGALFSIGCSSTSHYLLMYTRFVEIALVLILFNSIRIVFNAERIKGLIKTIAWQMFKERPFLGVGFNNFQIESHRFFPEGRIFLSKVHNIFLLLAAETGLIGVGCFILFLFSILRYTWRCMRSQEGLFILSLFIGFLFIGICDFYWISTPHGQILFFGVAALLSVVSKKNDIKIEIEKKLSQKP